MPVDDGLLEEDQVVAGVFVLVLVLALVPVLVLARGPVGVVAGRAREGRRQVRDTVVDLGAEPLGIRPQPGGELAGVGEAVDDQIAGGGEEIGGVRGTGHDPSLIEVYAQRRPGLLTPHDTGERLASQRPPEPGQDSGLGPAVRIPVDVHGLHQLRPRTLYGVWPGHGN